MRALKGLQKMIGISVVNWVMGERGWTFDDAPGVIPDPIHHAKCLHEIYTTDDPHFTGQVTVPLLWDRLRGRIVNNESSEILRMLGSAFDGLGAKPGDYYPEPLRDEIDALNLRIYDTVNNGVYRAGFATTQEAYAEAIVPLFETLDWLEQRLDARRFLFGDAMTEADIRLFSTLVRFDAVYFGHFKCNLRRIVDYPALWRFTREVYHLPGVAETVNMQHIKGAYYHSHPTINPTGIVPLGPSIEF